MTTYTVAASGYYDITAGGAAGGGNSAFDDSGGLGAVVSGEIYLTATTKLYIAVGGIGAIGALYTGGGGGGWLGAGGNGTGGSAAGSGGSGGSFLASAFLTPEELAGDNSDANGYDYGDAGFVTIDFVAGPAPVPEPGTLGLFASSLLGLGLIRQRRKRGA